MLNFASAFLKASRTGSSKGGQLRGYFPGSVNIVDGVGAGEASRQSNRNKHWPFRENSIN